MKKFSKLCAALLLLVALDARAGESPPPAVTADETMSEQRALDKAETQYASKNYREAAHELNEFLKRFPDSSSLSAVYFLLGSSYYGTQDCVKAIPAFQTLITRFTNSAFAPHAMLYMAECQRFFMQDKAAAWLTLNDLIKRFPSSDAAKTGKERLVGVGWGELVEFHACLDKSAPPDLLKELGRRPLKLADDDGVINLDKLIEDTLKRDKALKDAEVSGCANTLFKAFSAKPDSPLKSAKLRFASTLYKTLRSLELKEIDDKGATQAVVIAEHEMQQAIKAFNDNLRKEKQAAAQRKQQLDAQIAKEEAYIREMEASNALIEQYIQRLNAERSRQSLFDAARIINEVTKPVIVPQPVDTTTRRTFVGSEPALLCVPHPNARDPGSLLCR